MAVTPVDLDAIPMAVHERFMRLAIDEARRNPAFPFGAVIVRQPEQDVVAAAVNRGFENPMLHGEVAAIFDYVARNGHQGWEQTVLYTTGEPCPMCMSAIIWAGIGGVVYATSIETLKQVGIVQIEIGSPDVAGAAPHWPGRILGGVLAGDTDRMFAERPRGGSEQA